MDVRRSLDDRLMRTPVDLQLSSTRSDVGGEDLHQAEQLDVARMAETAAMPNITVQVLPAVAHPANPSELIVTDGAAYVEHLAGGLVYTEAETVTALSRVFTTIMSESEKASDSLAMFERLAETWATGASPVFQPRTAGHA